MSLTLQFSLFESIHGQLHCRYVIQTDIELLHVCHVYRQDLSMKLSIIRCRDIKIYKCVHVSDIMLLFHVLPAERNVLNNPEEKNLQNTRCKDLLGVCAPRTILGCKIYIVAPNYHGVKDVGKDLFRGRLC